MPRPCKLRRICALPNCSRFGPKENTEPSCYPVMMTLDEYESIRLIDLEGLSQEQCAAQLKVARTTAQAIYNSARWKLAECLTNGRELKIQGGQYTVCDGKGEGCCHSRCSRREPNRQLQEEHMMKIAVTYENGQVFPHFGHTAQFKIYEVESGAITSQTVVDTNGSGHGALAGFLRDLQVDTLICGGIGGGARMALEQVGITLYGGVMGAADDAVAALLSGHLNYDPNVMCSHHGEHHEGSCGHHGCGEHSCH